MIVCPVCEHQQAAAAECENCGKQLAPPRAVPVQVSPIQELEATRMAGAQNVAVAPVPELETTAMRGGPDLPPQRVQDLELTSVAPTGAVSVQPVPELDLGRAPEDGARTAAPVGAVTCRYCRNVQAEGLLCERCGMRLPRAAAAPASPKAAAAGADGDWTRCRDCGSRAKRGTRCGNCGHEVAGAAT